MTEPEEPATPTVNISEESIKAIAAAISEDGLFSMTISGKEYVMLKPSGSDEYNQDQLDFIDAMAVVPYKAFSINRYGDSLTVGYWMDTPPLYTVPEIVRILPIATNTQLCPLTRTDISILTAIIMAQPMFISIQVQPLEYGRTSMCLIPLATLSTNLMFRF